MAKQVSDLLKEALGILNDPRSVRWAPSELLGYLYDGAAALAAVYPEQFAVTSNLALVAGARQTIPADGFMIMRVNRALDNSDNPGRSVREVDYRVLSAHDPSWTAATGEPVREWARDPTDPTVFWVSPPQPATPQKAEVVYASVPSPITMASTLPTDETYASALLDYVVGRAFQKDSQVGSAEMAAMHMGRFDEVLNGQSA